MYVCDTIYKRKIMIIFVPSFPKNDNKDEIGGLTKENVNSACIQPVAEFLDRKVNEWLQAKVIELKLTVNEDTFTG